VSLEGSARGVTAQQLKVPLPAIGEKSPHHASNKLLPSNDQNIETFRKILREQNQSIIRQRHEEGTNDLQILKPSGSMFESDINSTCNFNRQESQSKSGNLDKKSVTQPFDEEAEDKKEKLALKDKFS